VQDFQDTKYPMRRHSDCELCEKMSKAFVLNELGEPDFDGHRRRELKAIEAEAVLQGYKTEATKKIIGWVTAILLGALSSGVVIWVKDHFK
jgi:hypothetical protein